MNKHLYCKVLETPPDTVYHEIFLDDYDKNFLETHNIYHEPAESGNSKYMVGIFQLRTMFFTR